MIREMLKCDKKQILAIYEKGLKTRNATFEINVPSWEEWNSNHHNHSRYVYLNNNSIIGWVALSPISKRYVYRGVSEISIYVDPDFFGRGIGSELIEKVIFSSEINGIWTLFASIFPENKASLRLHEKFGFRKIGFREKIASLDGIWRDTLILERRSTIVGL
jgi:phosphinothricin acetyltransferase